MVSAYAQDVFNKELYCEIKEASRSDGVICYEQQAFIAASQFYFKLFLARGKIQTDWAFAVHWRDCNIP